MLTVNMENRLTSILSGLEELFSKKKEYEYFCECIIEVVSDIADEAYEEGKVEGVATGYEEGYADHHSEDVNDKED